MINYLWESIYYLRDYAHPIGFSLVFLSGYLVFLCGHRVVAVLLSLPSAAVVFTTIMAWATHDPTPIEEHFPDGSYRMHYPESWWEQIQYPVYIWATLIVCIAVLVLSIQMYLIKSNAER